MESQQRKPVAQLQFGVTLFDDGSAHLNYGGPPDLNLIRVALNRARDCIEDHPPAKQPAVEVPTADMVPALASRINGRPR